MTIPLYAASATPQVASTVRVDSKSGRLVRTVVVKPVAVTLGKQAEDAGALADDINRIAAEQGVEESLVHSVIRAESNYNPYAISPKGAQGMMQLIPATAKRFGVKDSFDARSNVEGGVKYLKFLLDYYKGDYARAIAAYNAGEGAVDKYDGIPPYAETRNYVSRVARNLNAARQKRAAIAPKVALDPVKVASAATYNPVQTSVGSDGRVYYRTP